MKLTIKKYSSNILGMYKICDEKGYLKYHVVHESVGKLRLYEDDKELGCVRHKANNMEDIYEFCLHRKPFCRQFLYRFHRLYNRFDGICRLSYFVILVNINTAVFS